MRIVAVSDSHFGLLRSRNRSGLFPSDSIKGFEECEIPEGDLLIHAGDLDIYSGGDWYFFCSWISRLPHKHKVVIPGNHDLFVRDNMKFVKKESQGLFNFLMHESVIVEGFKIFGSPWTPYFGEWAFMYDREHSNRVWRDVPDVLDILVSHGPPKDILDLSSGTHCGCPGLLNRVLEIKPRLHVFGHIHDGAGMEERSGVTYLNASVLNDRYSLNGKTHVIDL